MYIKMSFDLSEFSEGSSIARYETHSNSSLEDPKTDD